MTMVDTLGIIQKQINYLSIQWEEKYLMKMLSADDRERKAYFHEKVTVMLTLKCPLEPQQRSYLEIL